MPYIHVRTTEKIDEIKKEVLESKLTKAITIIPGKTEAHLMCSIQDNVSMMFHNEKAPMAFVEVKLLGKSTKEAYGNLTAEVCKILEEEIGVSGEFCYVQFTEVENWGFNGFMF